MAPEKSHDMEDKRCAALRFHMIFSFLLQSSGPKGLKLFSPLLGKRTQSISSCSGVKSLPFLLKGPKKVSYLVSSRFTFVQTIWLWWTHSRFPRFTSQGLLLSSAVKGANEDLHGSLCSFE